MVTAKDCHTLTSYFLTTYKTKYKNSPVVNRNKARWGFEAVLMDFSMDEAKELIDFYLTTASANRHSLEWFLFNYDKMVTAKQSQKDDAERREQLRRESEQRAKEWRERGNTGISSN